LIRNNNRVYSSEEDLSLNFQVLVYYKAEKRLLEIHRTLIL